MSRFFRLFLPVALGLIAVCSAGAGCRTAAAAGAAGGEALDPAAAKGESASRGNTEDFLVFDALMHRRKPFTERLGLERLRVIYANSLWPKGHDQVEPMERFVRWHGRRIQPGQLVCVDIEHWPLRNAPREEIEQSIRKYTQVLRWLREEAPDDARLGYYGILPIRDYWAPVKQTWGETEPAERWEQANARLDKLAEHVDVVFPSLYTFYDDPQGWEVYAKANLEQARRYGKPVYPFLWFEYHNSNERLKGQQIDAAFWRRQLAFCRRHADGVVLWGGYRQRWDPDADWWRTTRRFLAELDGSGDNGGDPQAAERDPR